MRKLASRLIGFAILCVGMHLVLVVDANAQPSFSGIYPHLAYFNEEGECGTGAVVPWADRLWVVTYAPHSPTGSSDKLYEIDSQLRAVIRPESIGGTPANRMIHAESQQLFIGPYVIDAARQVRVIHYSQMFGRPTGNARHLTDPAHKVYVATMEEGFYEVDVNTLDVTTLYYDEQLKQEPKANLPGYHGKGLYSGQGRLVYANNGEHGELAQRNPFVPSGCLAEWDQNSWQIVLRNQFTEVTGPGGIYGNPQPANDPLWSIGWDARSLILTVLDEGTWHRFRLPKASHSYDGAHGWNTEWPRIRDIGQDRLLMTMHGMFWHFPRTFSARNTAGIAPRSSYLKVVGDFCAWNDRIVLGCDDTAKSEFLNKRRAKGEIAAPQSQSNLWFLAREDLDRLGPPIGRGAVWLNDRVEAGVPSDPFLVAGFGRRGLHLATDDPTVVTVEIDREGDGNWATLDDVSVERYRWYSLDDSLDATFVRLRSAVPLTRATAWFHFGAGAEPRPEDSRDLFEGVARSNSTAVVGGLVRARAQNRRTLHFAAADSSGPIGVYTLDEQMQLRRSEEANEWEWLRQHAAIPDRAGVLSSDAASVIYVDDNGARFRLPRQSNRDDQGVLGAGRLCREVATERDLFNCFGTFYELPANNAGGFAKIRPICTHDLQLVDYCSYRGLLVMSGIDLAKGRDNRHVIRSDDGKAALWVGAVDDIWRLGKPIGDGGPWLDSRVEAGEWSDPYLMTGYERRSLEVSSSVAASVSMQIDVTGMGDWHTYQTFRLDAGGRVHFEFPRGFEAYWVRFSADTETTATAQLQYR